MVLECKNYLHVGFSLFKVTQYRKKFLIAISQRSRHRTGSPLPPLESPWSSLSFEHKNVRLRKTKKLRTFVLKSLAKIVSYGNIKNERKLAQTTRCAWCPWKKSSIWKSTFLLIFILRFTNLSVTFYCCRHFRGNQI